MEERPRKSCCKHDVLLPCLRQTAAYVRSVAVSNDLRIMTIRSVGKKVFGIPFS